MDDMTNMITNRSILNISNQFLVQCRKKSNVIYNINLQVTCTVGEYNFLCFLECWISANHRARN